jgi:hypothetical protein
MRYLKTLFFASMIIASMSAAALELKPGLWEIRHSMQGDAAMNAQIEQARKQMAAMPPEQRKMMQDMMAKQGVQMDMATGGTVIKVCLTEEDIKRDSMPVDTEGKCKYDWKKSGNVIKGTFTCTDPASSGSGEWMLASAERYTMKMDVTSADKGGQPRKMSMSGEGKWLGADCKGLVPVSRKK